MELEVDGTIPLVDVDSKLLPVQFSDKEVKEGIAALIKKYLNVTS